jgi:hypothetical protein
MASILTNTSAMVALQNLRSINRNLTDTQNQIATGKKIATAKDNSLLFGRGTQKPHEQRERHHRSHKVGIRNLPGTTVVAGCDDFLSLDNNGRVGLRGHHTTPP